MTKKLFVLLSLCLSVACVWAQPVSPNSRLSITPSGRGFTISYLKKPVLNVPVVGYDGMKNNRPKWKFEGL